MVTGEFLSAPGSRPQTIDLTAAERRLKRRMFDAFATQRQVLKMFSLENEKFRLAPHYDFTQPPHDGDLQYERFGFAQGSEWRRRASRFAAVPATAPTAITPPITAPPAPTPPPIAPAVSASSSSPSSATAPSLTEPRPSGSGCRPYLAANPKSFL